MKRRHRVVAFLCVCAVLIMISANHDEPNEDGVETADEPLTGKYYLHASMNVRAGPGTDRRVLWQVHAGDTVRLGWASTSGWAEVFIDGEAKGYMNVRSDNIRPYPSGFSSSSPSRGASSGSDYAAYGPCAESIARLVDRFSHQRPQRGLTREGNVTVSSWSYVRSDMSKVTYLFAWGGNYRGCHTDVVSH